MQMLEAWPRLQRSRETRTCEVCCAARRLACHHAPGTAAGTLNSQRNRDRSIGRGSAVAPAPVGNCARSQRAAPPQYTHLLPRGARPRALVHPAAARCQCVSALGWRRPAEGRRRRRRGPTRAPGCRGTRRLFRRRPRARHQTPSAPSCGRFPPQGIQVSARRAGHAGAPDRRWRTARVQARAARSQRQAPSGRRAGSHPVQLRAALPSIRALERRGWWLLGRTRAAAASPRRKVTQNLAG
jgi:hypothetical protein